MTELSSKFERLGLLQYLDVFIEEGFDTWDIVLCATESDLEALGVKLGHRRKLQKEIAEARGITIEQVIGANTRTFSADDLPNLDSDAKSVTSQGDQRNIVAGQFKRKYRRHPKPDDNAPSRAPSAYVIFSNKTRRELQPLKLTFTDIAKTVGERWQVLDPEEKEQFEHQAAMAKEQYNTALSKYKRTSPYREYQIYLVDFKARNTPQSITGMLKRPMRMVLAQSQAGTKRPKLETEISGTSSGSGGSSNTLFNDSESRRKESTVSHPAYSPPVSSVASPTVVTRITTRSPDSSVQSSLPNTPINTVTPISNTSHIGPSQKGYEGSSHHLPRILPLDSRDSRPHITSLIADPLPFSNPRRTTTTTTPTAFLRHDTSKSSISSNLSGASTTSTGYTSATPIEEKRSSRSLPPIPSLLHHRSIDNVMISDGDPRAPQAPSPRFGIEFGELTSKQPMGYPSSFRHLSIQMESRDSRPSASQPQQNEAMTHSRSPYSNDAVSRQTPHGYLSGQFSTERLDPLSVLALAGRMVDQEYPESLNAKKPYNGGS